MHVHACAINKSFALPVSLIIRWLIRSCEVHHVKMHQGYQRKALSKLKSPLLQQLTMRSVCTWLPFKYVFLYFCSLTSLLKSDCAAIDSLQGDKQLRAHTCEPVNHVFLTFPSALRISSLPSLFLCMLPQCNQCKGKAYDNATDPEY